jgi:hypothetical protein
MPSQIRVLFCALLSLSASSAFATANYYGPGATVVNAVITGEAAMRIPCYDGMHGILAYVDVDTHEGPLATGGPVTFQRVSVRYTHGCHDCSMNPQ